MEEPTFSHHDDQGFPTEQREGHWSPALRPDTETKVETRSEISNETHHAETVTSLDTVAQPRLHEDSDAVPTIEEKQQNPSVVDNQSYSNGEGSENLDPAWGFKRSDSAHILDSAKRSSTFPKLSETGTHENTEQSSLSGFPSQHDNQTFDDLLAEEQEAEAAVPEHASEGNTIGKVDGPLDVASTEPIHSFENGIEEVSDSRFEEGIPLLASSHAQASDEQPTIPNTSMENAFESFGGEGDDEGSFFSQIPNQSMEQTKQVGLERKTTEDVLDALNLSSRKDTEDHDASQPLQIQGEITHDTDDFQQMVAAAEPQKNDSKWAAVLDDDEFLFEGDDDFLPDSEPGSPSSFIASLKEDSKVPGADLNHISGDSNKNQSNATRGTSNSYAPHQPSTSDMLQFSGNVGFNKPGLAPMGTFQNHVQQAPAVNKAESFADQAKGGYKSPYDLPMDLKPKRRPQTQRAPSQSQPGMPPPPPRSSSMSQGQVPGSTVTSPLVSNRMSSAPVPTPATQNQKNSASSFFEELPVTSKPRPSSNTSRYSPSQTLGGPPASLPAMSPPVQGEGSDRSLASPPQTSDPYAQFQLRPPEKVDPYANVALQPPSIPNPSASTNRYSPAPGAIAGPPRPTASPRYSPAPSSQPPTGAGRYASQPVATPPPNAGDRYASQSGQTLPATNANLPFMPRTSSPLAYHSKPPPPPLPATENVSNLMPPPPVPALAQVSSTEGLLQSPPRRSTPPIIPPPQTIGLPFSPPKLSESTGKTGFTPPRRSQTQSPSRQLGRPGLAAPKELANHRPQSAYSQTPIMNSSPQGEQMSPNRSMGRVKVPAPELDFEQPQDDTQEDPLQRWKGAPIFKFGFGGVILSSFPKRTPRYKAGQIKPQIKSTSGEVRTRSSRDLSLLPEHVTTFPGPLKGKSKKKDLLSWMTTTIAKLEHDAPVILGATQVLPDPRKCHEELILLWKIVKIIVENDGTVDNKPDALKAINVILSPEVHAIDESTASQYRADTELTGIYRPGGTNVRSDTVDPVAVEALRKHLMKGEREQAVWKAADSRLWSHAFLIASTFKDNSKIWKQVVQEFVRQEVKTAGNNSESLSALYEVFGGNMEESVDQLVPPSARAGLQMVSTMDTAGPTKNALEGLDKWKETLSLVLNNRTSNDQQALATLGALLANYGRIQAAHICFLFARNPLSSNVFGGVDDTNSSITLLGSDRRTRPLSFHQDHDAVLLTEAYEFAISALVPASMSMTLPHLAAYKLQRALDLADNGHKSEAQAYCDAVASSITSKNKMSPYYNTSLLTEVDELAKRLKQVPVQGASWIAKPSVERATSSLLSNLMNFVAGEDSDADSKGSAADVGPFAKTAGSPDLSRSGSQNDLYGSYPSNNATVPMTAAASRYAPGGMVSARSSTDLARGRSSLDSQRSPPTTSHSHEPRQSMYTPSFATNQPSQSPARSVSSYQPYGSSPSRNNYQPSTKTSYTPDISVNQQATLSPEQQASSYMPVAPSEDPPSYMPTQPEHDESQEQTEQPVFGGYLPSVSNVHDLSGPGPEEDESSGYAPSQSYAYEPPADTGYVPYQPDPDSDDDRSKKQQSKKKSFMDDNDDYSSYKPINSAQPAQGDTAAAKRKANDEAADAAFRAAAEADAQRAKEQSDKKKASGSWLGGWFGSKKTDAASLDAPKSSGGAEPKVHKAKLGEDKMKLYYDKDLKKWVNPDAPDSMQSKSTPPPPPGRSPAPPMSGGPPRMGGTPAPPTAGSRSSTPASAAGGEGTGLGIAATLPPSVNAGIGLPPSGTPRPASASGTPAPPTGGLAASSRPQSNASSIDDLIGPATGRKSAKGARGAKKGRYVDVMAQ